MLVEELSALTVNVIVSSGRSEQRKEKIPQKGCKSHTKY
jgi:hypothetical protein